MNSLIDRDPEKCGDKLTIAGTRLWLAHLWDHLEAGYSVKEYCDLYKVEKEKVLPIATFLKDND